jgi:hypothetical protein
MFRRITRPLTIALAVLAIVSSLARAATNEVQKTNQPAASSAPISGTVTTVHKQGTVTIRTEDGKSHRLKNNNWQVGDKVQCETKSKKTSCTTAS